MTSRFQYFRAYLLILMIAAQPTVWGQQINAKTIYADFVSLHLQERVAAHRVIAILPADVSIVLKKVEPDFAPDSTIKQQNDISLHWQRLFHAALNNNLGNQRWHLQPIDSTNMLLEAAGFTLDSFHYYSRSHLARVLHADALVQNDLLLSKMYSETESAILTLASIAASIAAMASPGYGYYAPQYYSTFDTDFTLSIYDASGELLWMARSAQQYEKKKARGKEEKEKRRFPYVKD